MDKKIFSRQISFFGIQGQEKIEKVHVGIVGLGGTGSHVVQQLAYLGVKKFTVIDGDVIEDINLNRLIGASTEDLPGSLAKTANAKRMLNKILPGKECSLTVIPHFFPSKDSLLALKEVDFIFGCVDNDGTRIILTEFAAAYKKYYIDLATEIDPQNMAFGGMVFFSIPGKSCLYCRCELSMDEIRKNLQSEAEKKEEEAIYGVPKELLQGSGPSVVSLNGIIASLAVTEFMVFVTGIRPANELLIYDGMRGIVTINKDKPSPNCYYCTSVKGIGDNANIGRFLQ